MVTAQVFKKIKAFFKSIFISESQKHEAKKSRYWNFVERLEQGSDERKLAAFVAELCDESTAVISQRLITIEKMRHYDEQLSELECFEKMSDEEAGQLKTLLDRFISFTKDRSSLRYQMADFSVDVAKLDKLEDEAHAAIENIEEAEEQQRIFEHDLSHLQGEKNYLEQERESLIKRLAFIQKFTIGMMAVFGVVAASLVVLRIVKSVDVFPALIIVTSLVMLSSAMLFALRKRMSYELAMNFKKQKKAVGMLNKKGVVYAHYTNFLDYEYKKFKVNSADMLKDNLKDFENYKRVIRRYDALRSAMSETEEKITKVLRENNILNTSMSLTTFAKSFNIADKKEYYRELAERRMASEKDLSKLDLEQEKIWDKLIIIDTSDTTENKTVHDIIENYMQHVSKIVERPSLARNLSDSGDIEKSIKKKNAAKRKIVNAKA